MRKKAKIMLIAVLAMLCLLAVSFFVGYHVRDGQIQPPVADTVRIEHWDTAYLPSPPDTITNTITKVVKVPLSDVEVDTGVDSANVTLPFEQHHATLEDVADIWFSGYQTKIDSAKIYRHHTTEIIKQPYEVTKMPVLSLNVGVGALYHEGQVHPYIYGKIPANFPKFPNTEFSVYGAIDHEGRWGAGVGISYRFNLIK